MYPRRRDHALASLISELFVAGYNLPVDIDRLRARFGFKPSTFALMLIRPLRDLIYGNLKPHAMLARSTFTAYDRFATDTPILFQDLIDEGLLVDLMHYLSTFVDKDPNDPVEAEAFELACYLLLRWTVTNNGYKLPSGIGSYKSSVTFNVGFTHLSYGLPVQKT
ncbi:hypothetical protein H0H92_006919 [Tricholoma furcatifolium]|nr:hypothetical protein H0H92_006919 [Tricholoma furcatifolium]